MDPKDLFGTSAPMSDKPQSQTSKKIQDIPQQHPTLSSSSTDNLVSHPPMENDGSSSSLRNRLAKQTNTTPLALSKQYNTAFYRLPIIMKEIESTEGVTPPQGLYYTNRLGKKIYLKEYQRKQWQNGQLPGCIKGCSSADLGVSSK